MLPDMLCHSDQYKSDAVNGYNTWFGAVATTNQDDVTDVTASFQAWTARRYNVTDYAALLQHTQ